MRDEYIVFSSDHMPVAFLTFKGYLFKGYQFQEQRKIISENFQSLGTMVIALGTGLAGLYAGLQFLDFYSQHSANWQMIAYFLSGFAIGLLLWLLPKLLRKSLHKSR